MSVYMHDFQPGTRVNCSLPYAGDGIIFAVHGDQKPGSVSSLGGVGVMGGAASLDVVFGNGSISKALPESLLRASCQWTVSEEVATEAEIKAAIENAEKVQADKAATAQDKKDHFAAEVARLKADPQWSHLKQGDDSYSGKLAAVNIRAELKRNFPSVKFSVRKTHYGSLSIRWMDGPTEKVAQVAMAGFKSGYYCPFEDLHTHEITPWISVFGGSDYISASREYSSELTERAIDALFNEYPGNFAGKEKPTAAQYFGGELNNTYPEGLQHSLQQLIWQKRLLVEG